MKKIQLFALSAFIGATTLVSCQQGGDSATPNTTLKTDIDTLSYAYGVQLAENGLGQYLQQLGVIQDTAMFKASFQQRIDMETDAAKKTELQGQLKTKLDSLNKVNSKNLALFTKGLNESFGAKNKDNDAYYSGLQIGGQIKQMSETFEKQVLADSSVQMNKSAFLSGLLSAVKNEKLVVENAGNLVNARAMANQDKVMKKQEEELKKQHADKVEAGAKFLAENKTKDGIVTLPSGVQYKIVKEGKGETPTAANRVKVNYKGTLTDGTVFDTNAGKDPVTFGVTEVIKGWTEVLQLMPVGSKWIVYIPYDLAYGAQQAGSIPPFSTLIFEVELLGLEK
ncbi:MAG: hypothetical protein RL662_2085 [Bacteroidota bacterium]|jgi:FKBP-type peptidyl-prolyl cis-trans isomerase FklB